MKKFMVNYHTQAPSGEEGISASPEEVQAEAAAWVEWCKQCGEAIVDFGAPLQPGIIVVSGSVAPSVGDVSGYSVIQAESIDGVARMLENHPHLQIPEASIEVLEVLPIPGM